MVCNARQEWNFISVLPSHPCESIKIFVPLALQMGWAILPPSFCTASKTARNVEELYASQPVGSLVIHPLKDFMFLVHNKEFSLHSAAAVEPKACALFLHLLEVYADDFIRLTQK